MPPAFDVAFADPPYDSPLARQLAERWLTAPFATIFGLEHAANAPMPPYPGGRTPDRRTYGITALTFYRTDDLDPQTEEQS
jgi:16S rRNA G966 N2-methylase RsmD